jgi:hypothetical protein
MLNHKHGGSYWEYNELKRRVRLYLYWYVGNKTHGQKDCLYESAGTSIWLMEHRNRDTLLDFPREKGYFRPIRYE